MAYRRRDRSQSIVAHLAGWANGRRVTRKAFACRFEVRAEGAGEPAFHNVHTATEALKLARAYADTGSKVYVRDRSRRRGYLRETELVFLAQQDGPPR